ncbi:MAG TPA: asparagine synthase C-terminal domain-containing protein [Usitatibacter sp.]|jgi:asparagine synthase (glutamine-hydrolysing)|nr:asparagine synthase C-terminal domain-containing protein [Usitatibacter sp.]
MDRVNLDTAVGDFLLVVMRDPARPLPPAPGRGAWRVECGLPRDVQVAPGIRLSLNGDAWWEADGVQGGMALVRAPEKGGAPGVREKNAREALRDFIAGRAPAQALRGRYLLVAWDTAARTVRATTDGFRTYPLHYHATAERLVCSTDLGLLLSSLGSRPEIDPAALYHYLNFAFVPSPFSPVRGVAKLGPDAELHWPPGRVAAGPCSPRYTGDLGGSESARAQALRERMIASVVDYLPASDTEWGTYLSGGTDSSSIAGILSKFATKAPFDTFSIGFGEQEFDEREYALLAAHAYGLANHTRDVSEKDALAAIPDLVRAFDEPFGNPSAIGSYYCARLARASGKRVLIAGDGGDEIFGGNERYAKDQVFGWYHRAPRAVHALGRGISAALAPFGGLHLANRLRRMEARGRMPNPDRFYADTSFASDHFEALLEPGFRDAVSRDASLELARELYRLPEGGGDLDRILYVDLRLTIADSDLVKVNRTARLAGIEAVFPYLDRPLVEFTGRLPERDKVRGLEKRWLFKRAMAGILPERILRKKKKGFGMPVSVWLRGDGGMRELVRDTVLSQRALGRGYVRPAFVRELLDRHEKGAWDYSSEIYRLLMLELWHGEFIDGP